VHQKAEDMSLQFLATPAEIRLAVGKVAQASNRLDLAVAFIGGAWSDRIANFKGDLRVICWLSSTNTDPRAVRQLMKRPKTNVRQRDGMHAKVYIGSHIGVVVGSANLSSAALAEFEQSGRDEAAVLLTDKTNRNTIARWFRALWESQDTRTITNTDLEHALKAFRKARQNRVGRPPFFKAVEKPVISPATRRQLAALARRAREQNLSQIGWLRRTIPRKINKSLLGDIVDEFEKWMSRRFLFERAFLKRSPSTVRKAITHLFDESVDIEERLSSVMKSRALAPLKISTLSLLLYWHAPEKYPPFNRRTQRFLKDFKLKHWGVSNTSPAAYKQWLQYAEQLSLELDLPTPGHIDRAAWLYTENLDL
jgi:hypothetical protein